MISLSDNQARNWLRCNWGRPHTFLTVITVTQHRSRMTDADWAAIADPLQINEAFALFPLDAQLLSRPPDESHR